MTYIVSSGALNSTPTSQRGTWQIVLRYHRSVDFFYFIGVEAVYTEGCGRLASGLLFSVFILQQNYTCNAQEESKSPDRFDDDRLLQGTIFFTLRIFKNQGPDFQNFLRFS